MEIHHVWIGDSKFGICAFFLLLMFSLFFFHHISLACSLLNVFLLNVFIDFLSLYSFGKNSLTKTVLIL